MKEKRIEWNLEKNRILKDNRETCFEDIVKIIDKNEVLDVIPHFNQEKYPNQKLMIVSINGYIHYVPFVEDNEKYFLKSIIPSRKHHNIYKLK